MVLLLIDHIIHDFCFRPYYNYNFMTMATMTLLWCSNDFRSNLRVAVERFGIAEQMIDDSYYADRRTEENMAMLKAQLW